VEILKLVSHKLFPAIVIITLVLTVALAAAARAFTEGPAARIRFSNYTLWVASSSYGLRVSAVLLVALGAMAMASEATSRTLNTILARPLRRLEFAAAKALSLLFATVSVVAAAALAAYIVGGTIQEEHRSIPWETRSVGDVIADFPTYGDVVDPDYPDTVIATKGEVMREILFGYLLLVLPVLAGMSLGFLLGTLLDSTGLAIGLSVGVFLTLEATKFIPLFEDYLGRYAYNYPMNRIASLMLEAGKGSPPVWDDALAGVGVSAIYVGVSLLISLCVFCRRDITL
jgi:ABC-type transport system involved in multi-copper enzyme maturation permease subunit